MKIANFKALSGWALTILTLTLSSGATVKAQTAIPLKFHGGRILTSFTIYPLYYGNWPDTSAQQNYLQALARHMSGMDAPPGQKPMIWQYGVNQVSVAAAVTSSQPAITPRTVTDSDILNIIHQNQQPTTQTTCVAGPPGSKPICTTKIIAPAKLPAYGPGVLILVLLSKDYPLNCGLDCGAYPVENCGSSDGGTNDIGQHVTILENRLLVFRVECFFHVFRLRQQDLIFTDIFTGNEEDTGLIDVRDALPSWRRTLGDAFAQLA
jgi:hypothetical protein